MWASTRTPTKPTGALNGTGENIISPFSRGYPPERDDVGIVPYIPSGCVPFNGAWGKPSGCGRLVAAPTGSLGCMPLNRAGMGTFLGRDDVGIVPYISAGLRAIQPGASSPWGGGRPVAAPTGVLVCVPFIRAGCI